MMTLPIGEIGDGQIERITSAEIIGVISSRDKVLRYVIEVSNGKETWKTQKRYSVIHKLRKDLMLYLPSVDFKFPTKFLLRKSEANLQKRRDELQEFLRNVVAHDKLSKSQQVTSFFSKDDEENQKSPEEADESENGNSQEVASRQLHSASVDVSPQGHSSEGTNTAEESFAGIETPTYHTTGSTPIDLTDTLEEHSRQLRKIKRSIRRLNSATEKPASPPTVIIRAENVQFSEQGRNLIVGSRSSGLNYETAPTEEEEQVPKSSSNPPMDDKDVSKPESVPVPEQGSELSAESPIQEEVGQGSQSELPEASPMQEEGGTSEQDNACQVSSVHGNDTPADRSKTSTKKRDKKKRKRCSIQ